MYRINTFEIRMPALRERLDDVPELARHLLARRRSARASEPSLTQEALDALQEHCWPGNVRELANVIEHATILGGGGPIAFEHLPANFSQRKLRAFPLKTVVGMTLRDIESAAIQQALERHHGHKSKAAEELGISVKTLYNRMQQLGDLEQSA
jgi:two-component system NtrC family response regulator